MLVVLAAVLVIDWVSVKIRDKYIMKAQHGAQLKIKKLTLPKKNHHKKYLILWCQYGL